MENPGFRLAFVCSAAGGRLDWSTSERRFLDRLHDEGVVDAEALHADSAVQERIRTQPMLLWKAQNVRNFLQGDA